MPAIISLFAAGSSAFLMRLAIQKFTRIESTGSSTNGGFHQI
jgi:hypothetical protein